MSFISRTEEESDPRTAITGTGYPRWQGLHPSYKRLLKQLTERKRIKLIKDRSIFKNCLAILTIGFGVTLVLILATFMIFKIVNSVPSDNKNRDGEYTVVSKEFNKGECTTEWLPVGSNGSLAPLMNCTSDDYIVKLKPTNSEENYAKSVDKDLYNSLSQNQTVVVTDGIVYNTKRNQS